MKMDNNTKLTITYGELIEMLEDAQHDALAADGCFYDCVFDPQKEIEQAIRDKRISIAK